jgi:uncharacterized RDD family membrane protein YckC
LNCSKCGVEIAEGAAYCSACGEPQLGRPRVAQTKSRFNISEGATAEDATPDDAMPGDLVPEGATPGGEAIEDARASEPQVATSPGRFVYAGFWLRLAAYIIDSLALGLTVGVAVLMPLMSRGAISATNPWAIYTNTSRQYVALQLLLMMIQWVYFALLESSAWQASLGKRALGLVVTDLEGKRISFGRASARYFCSLLSSFILMIGFIMIAFTQRKQGLHDILTGCLVIKKV